MKTFKLLVFILVTSFIVATAHADDPGPLAPCYALLSDGWTLLQLRDKGMTLEEMKRQIDLAYKGNPDDEMKQNTIKFVEEVFKAPGDGWDWITEEHRKCIRRIKYGEGQD